MDLPIDTQGDRSSLRLPAALEIGNVVELKAALQPLVDAKPATVAIDLEDVISVDVAGMQLLISLIRSLQAQGGNVQWDNLSVPLYTAACELGLEDHLQL